MNWRIVAIPASTIPIIIIAIHFDIKLEDLFSIGLFPFIAAVALMMGKLVLQGLKFGYIARTYLGKFESLSKLTGVRMGSEFIKFTTPMFVGAEFIVIYWLHKKGISPSKASWIAILDIVTEVLAGGALSIIAGILALINGAILVGIVVLSTSIFVTTLWLVLFLLSSKRTFHLPGSISKLVIKIGKEKGIKYVEKTNMWIKEVCDMSRQNLRTPKSRKVFVNGFIISIASWICYGASFVVIAYGTGYFIGIFDSIMAVMGANAIGNLPITVGGSGLVEVGIVAYLNNLNPFNLEIPEESIQWSAVIGWRLATYYVPIGITWILLVKLALSKYNKPTMS